MRKFLPLLVIFCCLVLSSTNLSAQFNPAKGCIVDLSTGECLPNTILSAVPFLRIIPDARSGAMGDAGIGLNPDPNAMHFNSAKLAFVDKEMSISATYTPWLRDLGLDDVYLAYLSGFRQIDELSSVGFGLRFFSLGDINFTGPNGENTGFGSPRELEFAVGYARKLGENFSTGLNAKYIYSNLASGQSVQGIDINAANAFAVDLSLFYTKPITISSYESDLNIGMTISDVGSKITYTNNSAKDFLPMNMGLGAGLTINFDEFNQMTFAFDINKLLLPTPVSNSICEEVNGILECVDNPLWDENNNNIADYREQGMFNALLGSFGDAQGGFSEELKELNYSFGIEYWYDQQFAVRTGYYYENQLKGNRQFLTVGLGLKYNVFGLNLSYLVPTNNRRNPLDNTLRFSLIFDFTQEADL